MKYIINGYDYGIEGPYISKQEKLNVKFKNNFSIFSLMEIYSNIIRAQQNGDLIHKWLIEDSIEIRKALCSDKNIDTSLTLIPDHFNMIHKNSYHYSMIKILFVPETNEEFDFVMSWLFKNNLGKCHSGIMMLPDIKGFKDDFDIINVGNKYLVGWAFEKLDFSTSLSILKKYDSYYWVINKDDLNKNRITVHCPDELIGHAIGKKGKNIDAFKQKLFLSDLIDDPNKLNIRIQKINKGD